MLCYSGGRPAYSFLARAISLLILLNVAAIILESVEWFAIAYASSFYAFEVFSVAVFTAEYLLRLWSCTENPRYKDPLRGRLKYAATPLALIDLLAIVPFYLPMNFDARALRLLRLLRLFKIGRYSRATAIILRVLRQSKDPLTVTITTTGVLLVVAATLLYYAENEAQPDVFSSIPAALWWGVATLTTVGYGDIYPITPLGKVFASFIAIFAVGLFALPTGILSAGFIDALAASKSKSTYTTCPHCGQPCERGAENEAS